VGNDFAHRAISISLIHRKAEFLVRRMQDALDLNSFATLADLADALRTSDVSPWRFRGGHAIRRRASHS
jgi:hypothetical protein